MTRVRGVVDEKTLTPEGSELSAAAHYVGERVEIRRFSPRLIGHATLLAVGERGRAVVFRYGAVVLFDVEGEERRKFFEEIQDLIIQPFAEPEREPVDIRIDAQATEGVDDHGTIILREASPERLQIVAEVLAKSVVLAQYEEAIAHVFASVEPLAEALERTGRGPTRTARPLLKQIGRNLMIQHKMVGRVEVLEKPELLWENTELERIYLLLEDEYELRERHLALERKLGVVNSTAETLVELLQARRSLRVEWYIVLLIVAEILIMLWAMFVPS